jgi:heat shock protein HslJ
MNPFHLRDLFISLALLGALTLSACAPMEPPAPGAGNQAGAELLAGSLWNLVGYGQPEALTPPVAEALATLDIDAEHMGGTTGCNHYSYTYTQTGQTLTFAEPGPMVTLMACPEPLMQQETDMLRVFSAVTGFVREGNRLTLTGAEGVLVFEAAEALPLEGTAWQLSGLAQNEAVVSTLVDETITLTLADGQANGFAGCNNYFGSYETTGSDLTFGPLASTKKACEGDVGQREAEFLAALERVASYRVERSHLTLLDSSGALVMALTVSAAR